MKKRKPIPGLVDVNGKNLFKVEFKKPLDEMTPEERIKLANQFKKASREYIRQKTNDFFRKLREGKHSFNISAKWELIKTMPPLYLEVFLQRMARFASLAEGFDYTVKFSKWHSTREYGWLFMKEES